MAKKSKPSELSPKLKADYTDYANKRFKSFQKIMDRASNELAAIGFDPPGRSIWKWKRMGEIVNIYTTAPDPRQIADAVLAWSLKTKHQEKIRVQAQLASQSPVHATDEPEICYVTMLQMAAIIGKKKCTIERLKNTGKIPAPDVKGGNGKAHEWLWSVVAPILEENFNRKMPKEYPSTQFIRS
jgi:hypothetical protein